jgi:hypothetical protein
MDPHQTDGWGLTTVGLGSYSSFWLTHSIVWTTVSCRIAVSVYTPGQPTCLNFKHDPVIRRKRQ